MIVIRYWILAADKTFSHPVHQNVSKQGGSHLCVESEKMGGLTDVNSSLTEDSDYCVKFYRLI